jgi:hypothetical protein
MVSTDVGINNKLHFAESNANTPIFLTEGGMTKVLSLVYSPVH